VQMIIVVCLVVIVSGCSPQWAQVGDNGNSVTYSDTRSIVRRKTEKGQVIQADMVVLIDFRAADKTIVPRPLYRSRFYFRISK
jgi:uncharacterized protein YceK